MEEEFNEEALTKRCIDCAIGSYKQCDECLRNIIGTLNVRVASYRNRMKENKVWLADLIDTSKVCLLDNRFPSFEYEKLIFQLEAKLKELRSMEEVRNNE